MKPLAALFAACLMPGLLASKPAHAFQGKGANHAAEQHRKAMEAEFKHQQELEKKLIQQQQHAMAEQAKAEQKFFQNQQKAMQHQEKLMHDQQQKLLHEQQKAMQSHLAGIPHGNLAPAYHATRPYYGHHYYGHPHRRVSDRNYRQMPTQLDPETIALQNLKRSLDAVKPGVTVTSAEKSAIKNALMRVVEVPKVPSLASITSLAGHLGDALANRGGAAAQTGPMALTLRGALNSPMLAPPDLTLVMNEHRAALKESKVRPAEVAAVMDALKVVSNQERAHH